MPVCRFETSPPMQRVADEGMEKGARLPFLSCAATGAWHVGATMEIAQC
jgi:hypothetical protein